MLPSRDSADIGNNMASFIIEEYRTKGGNVVTNGATDNARTVRRVSNFNRSL